VGAALVAARRRAVTEALGEAPGGALSEEAAGG
jgi:hypothetical protein